MDIKDVDGFIYEFNGMRKMMIKNLKGIDIDAMDDPNGTVQSPQAQLAQAKKDKKMKPTRGGGGGFGSK